MSTKAGLIAASLVLAVAALTSSFTVKAADAGPKIAFDAGAATPRQVEEGTVKAVTRDYAAAWKSLGEAVEQNRADLLNANFAGTARERFGALVESQAKNGLRQRYVDRGHKVQVIFYSADGSSMQVRDTAQVEIQLLDGSEVVHSEQATVSYLALLTPAENSWKVRVLESVPEF